MAIYGFKEHKAVSEIYPIGSIYLSVSDMDPGDLFGGEWERIQDKFLLAAGATYAAGATGGETEHRLTVQELPAHKHEMNKALYSYYQNAPVGQQGMVAVKTDNYDSTNTNPTHTTGGGLAHNNMPPYLAVYVWVRTA